MCNVVPKEAGKKKKSLRKRLHEQHHSIKHKAQGQALLPLALRTTLAAFEDYSRRQRGLGSQPVRRHFVQVYEFSLKSLWFSTEKSVTFYLFVFDFLTSPPNHNGAQSPCISAFDAGEVCRFNLTSNLTIFISLTMNVQKLFAFLQLLAEKTCKPATKFCTFAVG